MSDSPSVPRAHRTHSSHPHSPPLSRNRSQEQQRLESDLIKDIGQEKEKGVINVTPEAAGLRLQAMLDTQDMQEPEKRSNLYQMK